MLVQLLSDAGADVNNRRLRLYGGTALAAAAENRMTRYLLGQGPDPDGL